ncbi:hypothetical protein [Hoeflea sp. BAL378]|uniref:hypothetical protein n=1 Tax=Hoeflea sp. BAL378 TaxID=1547437 RepID=UPI000A685220|nr:hypothetical protein [Hoeflea sp. BAL378]
MHGYEYVFRMNGQTNPSAFELPANAPQRIRRFHDLWIEKGAGALPDASHFDVAELGADFPLLARIGVDGQTLIWRDFVHTQSWPFGPPVKDAPVEGSVPPLSVKRVLAAFQETLESAIPDYFETTSWMQGGRTVSLARLVAPLTTGAGRELIALWEIMEPPAVP